MTPTERYQRDVAEGTLLPDPAQALTIGHLQRVYDDLLQGESPDRSRLSPMRWVQEKMLPRKSQRQAGVRGLYMYGGVGRGKTYMMDIFFESLPFPDKMRTHFHRFMQRVHAELARLKQQKNPLETVARKIAREARVICFDEFFVSDIGDAIILSGLLTSLIEEGVTLVATSNIEPGSLYKDGLQRARFLPAIALLQQCTEVVELDGGVDYRLRALQQARLFHSPLGAEADAEMMRSFKRLAPEHAEISCAEGIEVLGRVIKSRMCADDVIWFDFEQLCGGPRSAYDYIELAKVYHAILISNVRQMGGDRDDMARRFVSLVDEFYDRHVKLVISAEVPLLELYVGTSLAFVFERTSSRLLEMQSHDYLGKEHRA